MTLRYLTREADRAVTKELRRGDLPRGFHEEQLEVHGNG